MTLTDWTSSFIRNYAAGSQDAKHSLTTPEDT